MLCFVQDISLRELYERLDKQGTLEEKLINSLWADHLNQKQALLGLMQKFDLIAERKVTNVS